MSDKTGKKKASGGSKKTPRRRKGDAVDVSGPLNLSIASDPRARHSVRQAKAWVGLGGFGLALLLSLQAGVPLAIAGERALIAGVAGWLVGWGCAVMVWRALLIAELRAHADRLRAEREATVEAPAGAKAAR